MKKKAVTVKPSNQMKKTVVYITSAALIVVLLTLFCETIIRTRFKDRISHNVFILDTNISGYNKNEFFELLDEKNSRFDKITVSDGKSENQLYLSDIKYSVDYQKNWEGVYRLKKSYLSNPYSLSFTSFFKKVNVKEETYFDDQLLLSELEKISSIVSVKPIFESITLDNNNVKIISGKDGLVVNEENLKQLVINAIQNKIPSISIPLEQIKSSIPEDQKGSLLDQANNLKGKKVLISLEDKNYEIGDKDLVETLNDRQENKFENIEKISENVTNFFSREPKNSVFVFESGKVSEFTPSEDGIIVDIETLKKEVVDKRNELILTQAKEITILLPHQKISPKITMGDINNIGIKEKIGSGYSTFKGSIASRIHNIKLASSKFNGVLIAPGETMSFNKTLGDVSKVTGYQPAYIIQDGQTILGDGGGVCQVSTTLFRSALNAGLPIIERRSHSYRVAYYEQGFPPGLDATVFDPTTDLKIKNNTDNHILIQTTFDEKGKTLTFNLYGTKDGRIVTLGKPVIKDSTPPPDDLYIDDPTLKIGVIKQIDYKAWGAKVYFNYKVEKDSSVIYEKTFYSNYQPWQAKYLRGTAP